MNEKDKKIVIRGAREHNLKNINLELPRDKMICFTGLSGSGKSSLAFDTIFSEGQRRYIESLSSYARQFLNKVDKPDVDEITGLSPSIAINQKSRSNNPRSTIATITEIYDYLRVLYARIGQAYSPKTGKKINKLSVDEITNLISTQAKLDCKNISKPQLKKTYLIILSPIIRGRKGEHYQLLYNLLKEGYGEIRLDGQFLFLREKIDLNKNKKHEIDLVIDKLSLAEFSSIDSDTKTRLFESVEKSLLKSDGLVLVLKMEDNLVKEKNLFSAKFSCPETGYSFPEIEPRLFSFNSPYGACSECNGLGTKYLFSQDACQLCLGARLREEALNIFLGIGWAGEKKGLNIFQLTNLSILEVKVFFESLKLTKKEKEISNLLIKEIISRLDFMIEVGIAYLTLNRRANTLSGGESQRIRLASQLGSGLVGAIYVLDEPTIGLHQSDNDRLIKSLIKLKNLGNTIIVVEHDEDTILSSDYLVDIGPGAGILGGEVVAEGELDKLLNLKKSKSLTLDYLTGRKKISVPKKRRKLTERSLKIKKAEVFNLKKISITVPLGIMCAISGVSGSGKSTFLYEIIYKNLKLKVEQKFKNATSVNSESFIINGYPERIVLIDQSAIGRTPRSNPATYTGTFSLIRDLFAETITAKEKGYKIGRFSFNVKGGRCEACQGNGQVAIEMHFLPTVFVECDVCRGKRFNQETLEVKYGGKNVSDVLEMDINNAYKFFKHIPQIEMRLKTLLDVGLGYIKLGQSATTLSGGEAQRVKIASELFKKTFKETIYILDEPTIGLHYEDVKKLIEILNYLVESGNSVILIEHNLDVLKSADFLIDFGPEGGLGGGRIIASGTPEQIIKDKNSLTGKYLKRML